jgi:hypothetical protein
VHSFFKLAFKVSARERERERLRERESSQSVKDSVKERSGSSLTLFCCSKKLSVSGPPARSLDRWGLYPTLLMPLSFSLCVCLCLSYSFKFSISDNIPPLLLQAASVFFFQEILFFSSQTINCVVLFEKNTHTHTYTHCVVLATVGEHP